MSLAPPLALILYGNPTMTPVHKMTTESSKRIPPIKRPMSSAEFFSHMLWMVASR
jgi:hypothetical protein